MSYSGDKQNGKGKNHFLNAAGNVKTATGAQTARGTDSTNEAASGRATEERGHQGN